MLRAIYSIGLHVYLTLILSGVKVPMIPTSMQSENLYSKLNSMANAVYRIQNTSYSGKVAFSTQLPKRIFLDRRGINSGGEHVL